MSFLRELYAISGYEVLLMVVCVFVVGYRLAGLNQLETKILPNDCQKDSYEMVKE